MQVTKLQWRTVPRRREKDTFTIARAGRWWRRECTPHSKQGWLWLQVTVQDNSVIAFNGCCFRAILEQCMNYELCIVWAGGQAPSQGADHHGEDGAAGAGQAAAAAGAQLGGLDRNEDKLGGLVTHDNFAICIVRSVRYKLLSRDCRYRN